MAIDKHELFQHLMEQIDWQPESELTDYFAQTQIQEVIVHTKSKRWTFLLDVPDIMPYQTFVTFSHQLRAAFGQIAKTEIAFTSRQPVITNQNLGDYWQWVVKTSGVSSPMLISLAENQVPYLDGERVILLADNEIVQDFLKKTALGPIEASYQRMGFPKFNIQTIVDNSKTQEKITEYKKKRAENDAQLAQKALEAIKQKEAARAKQADSVSVPDGPLVLGKPINENAEIRQMNTITEEEKNVFLEGYVFDVEVRTFKTGRKLLTMKVTDYTSSFVVKKFSNNDEEAAIFETVKKGIWVKVRGPVKEDEFLRDLAVTAYDINEVGHPSRKDLAPEGEKRAELHLHTTMSTMDATNSISEYVTQAAKWGHKAIAVTDHGNLQAFPEAHSAGKKNGVKILYGLEASVVEDGTPIAYNEDHVSLKDATYVVFDTETTSLSAAYGKLIEVAAVKMKDGEVIAEFEEFIDPGFPLSPQTTELTHITNEMVRGSKSEEEVLRLFKEFCQGTIMVAHNAVFDIDYINTAYSNYGIERITEPLIDTLTLAWALYPDMKRYGLANLTKKFKLVNESHHRAIYDAEVTGQIYYRMLKDTRENLHVEFHDELNAHSKRADSYQKEHPFNATIIAKTQAGLKNLFKLASLAMTKYFYQVPRIPRSVLEEYREGLVIGTGDGEGRAVGEVFDAMARQGYEHARRVAEFYDYLEVHPSALYADYWNAGTINSDQQMQEIIGNIVKLGKEMGKPVVAAGDVHYLNPEDAIYREILVSSQGGANILNRLPQLPDAHFRTTDEMMTEFGYLGEELAHEIVIDNPQIVVDWCEEISPVKDKLYTPKMEGAEDDIRNLTMNKAEEWYGNPLPDLVQARIDKELKSVIGNGFSVIYLISQKLVHKSNKDGYLVGSRGSVGSSLVATLTGITEVNPLPPHYRCPNCKYSFFYEKGEYGSGYDLPDKNCPECQTPLVKDGQDIPFETFLGFKGNKVPDIDLNFSGDYQPIAHNYTKVLFGENNVYRAGTIGTVAEKTAYGYVKAYERDHDLHIRAAEVDRLAMGATGVKRTTGQHPAGILVVPDYMDIYDFTPIQYPADDVTATWRTTHFDFHSIHDNILKLDILGHDDPTMIRMLQDLSGIEPKTIPTDDPGVMALFSGTEILGVTPEQIQSKTGTLGVPEFGTRFVRGMLEETKPKTFAELLKISGLSHGTDVWLGNAEELIQNGTVTMPEVIGCRDDIMMDLIHMGVESDIAFKIMESVRKGKGIPDDWQAQMREANVPEWYIGACLKIKYMFPKAHAAAYVLMALRIAYFKVYFPLVYYSAYFSVRADDFDVEAMAHGKEAVKARMKEINDQGNDATAKDKNLLTVLELANEMLERGFEFEMVNLERSDATDWLIEDNKLLAPFTAIPGLGLNVAKQIVAAREEQAFLSKEDLSNRGKVSNTLIEFMSRNHVLDDLPDENQLSLFDDIF